MSYEYYNKFRKLSKEEVVALPITEFKELITGVLNEIETKQKKQTLKRLAKKAGFMVVWSVAVIGAWELGKSSGGFKKK